MWTRILTALLTIIAIVSFAQSASAQYMYLDTNGNGVHDAGDRLNGNGAATMVDLYLRTNLNRDGSPAVCDNGSEPLTINSYAINLLAVSGTVTYSGFVNRQQATMPNTVGALNPDGVRYKNGFFGLSYSPPGILQLCTLTITGVSGSPRIDIVDLVSESTDFTGFGTQCPGKAFDNYYRLDGPNTRAYYGDVGDFTDRDGLIGPDLRPPELAPIGNKTVDELTPLAFTATATDPDASQSLTFSLDAGAPPGATINASTGAFGWIPTEAQGPGSFPITVRVTDSGTPPLSDSETITVTTNEVNTAPVVANPGNKFVTALSTLAFTVTATDSDIPANAIAFSLALGTPAATGATINISTGAFSWTPTQAQANQMYPVTITATDNGTPSLSGSTAITITVSHGDTSPVVTNPGNKTTNELANLAFTVTASDPDVPPLTITWSLTFGLPAATGATIGSTTGAFSWTPTEAQGPGVYPLTIRATTNASPPASGTATITITVNEVNAAPVLAPIGSKTACGPGAPFTFTATATDVDVPANTLTFSLDPGAPAGATIGAATGVFNWTPSTGGSFPVTIRVTDNGTPALNDFEVITITVSLGANPAPVLGAIGNKTVDELATLTFTATATDEFTCGSDIITFSLDAGSPAGAMINGPTGAFSWTPTEAQGPGSFPITVRATDNGFPAMSDFETFTVTVNEVNAAPVLAAIGTKATTVGSPLAFTATATDADIPANVLCFSLDGGAPPGVTMNCSTGAFMWTPTPGQLGTFVITVRVTDNGAPPLSDSETITILVAPGATTPTADAGGPYTGIVNRPVNFDGTGSFDPTGDVLTYHWDFGDGNTGTGATPAHTYTAPGTYNVILRVTDPDGNFDEDVTTVTIRAEISVALLLKNGKTTINLGSNDVLKVALEEIELSYESIVVGSLRLSTDFPNAGTVAECAADSKHTRVGDMDGNGVPDLELRFPMACIRNLFRNTPNNSTVNLILTGEFETSTGPVPLRGVIAVTIKRGGGGGSAPVLAYPNPFNPEGRLSFETTRPGSASIQLFDLQGRLARTLLAQQYLGAGAHEVTIDGRNDHGVPLSSGVYFYRVWTADGIMEGSISILK